MVVATSTLLDGIEEALVDRADLMIWMGEPRFEATKTILDEVLAEFQTKGKVGREGSMEALEKVAKSCTGLSGRAMRKLSGVAMTIIGAVDKDNPVAVGTFLRAMDDAARMMQTKKGELLLEESTEAYAGMDSPSNPFELSSEPFPIEEPVESAPYHVPRLKVAKRRRSSEVANLKESVKMAPWTPNKDPRPSI